MYKDLERDSTDLAEAVANLQRDVRPGGVRACLSAASVLVEHAAYELARGTRATHVSSLILISAQLDRIAQGLPPAADTAD